MIDGAAPPSLLHKYITACLCRQCRCLHSQKRIFRLYADFCLHEWAKTHSGMAASAGHNRHVGGYMQSRNCRRYETTAGSLVFFLFFLLPSTTNGDEVFFLYNTRLFFFLSFPFSEMVSYYNTNYLLRYELCCYGSPLWLPLYTAAGSKWHKKSWRFLLHSESSFLIAESLDVAKFQSTLPQWYTNYLFNMKITSWRMIWYVRESTVSPNAHTSHVLVNTNIYFLLGDARGVR